MNTAEKIYAASTFHEGEVARLAEELATRIEDDLAQNPLAVGSAIGSVRELSERYGVGRAAAREAITLLERRGLGRLRPGPGGGFVVGQPNAEAIANEIADYFRMSAVTRNQLFDARRACDGMAIMLTVKARPKIPLLSLLTGPEPDETPLDWHLRIRGELAEMTGKPIIGVFRHCLDLLTVDFAKAADEPPEWRSTAHDVALRLRRALESADNQAALQVAMDMHRDIGNWMVPDDGPLPQPMIETGRMTDDRTLSTVVARRLAAEIVGKASSGQRLGSEWELCERFSISRAILRQAIRQLQDSGLVECRRGRGNGLVARDPRGIGSIRLLIAYMISHQANPLTAGTLLFQLNRFIPALAVHRADAAKRRRLQDALERARRNDPIDRVDLLRLVQCVAQLASSPIIDLFSRSLAAYEARFHPMLAERLPAHKQGAYFDLLDSLLADPKPGSAQALEEGIERSTYVLLDMSQNRPL